MSRSFPFIFHFNYRMHEFSDYTKFAAGTEVVTAAAGDLPLIHTLVSSLVLSCAHLGGLTTRCNYDWGDHLNFITHFDFGCHKNANNQAKQTDSRAENFDNQNFHEQR